MGFNALKRSALYKPFFLNYCHHMPRSRFLGIIGSVQQEVYSFVVIFFIRFMHMPHVAIARPATLL